MRLLQFNNRVALSSCNRHVIATLKDYIHIFLLYMP